MFITNTITFFFYNCFCFLEMHDALQTESTEQLQNILTELCNSVITEEDCKNQVIQDALNVSCDEEMNNLLE